MSVPMDFVILAFIIKVLLVGVSGVIGLFLLYLSFSWMKERQAMRSLKLSRIADAKSGVVKVVGTVVPLASLVVSPITKQQCVYYDVGVGHMRGRFYRTDLSSTIANKFYLQDASGKILVDPLLAHMLLKRKLDCYSCWGFELPQQVQNSLKDLQIDTRGFLLHWTLFMDVHEKTLLPGATLHISGGVDTTDQGEPILAGAPFLVIADEPVQLSMLSLHAFYAFIGGIVSLTIAALCLNDFYIPGFTRAVVQLLIR